jgi:hypothetical protein
MRRNTLAWEISENDFPVNGTTQEKMKYFVSYAILAPSGHNTQPWLFKLNEDSLDVIADRTRALPVIDPEDTELIISVGAALENLLVAMKYFGYEPIIKYYPDEGDNDLLARIMIGKKYEPSENDTKLFKAIPNRRTNRTQFAEQGIDGLILQKFEACVYDERVNLMIIKDEAKREDALKLIERGDRKQCEDKSFCRELAQWVHPNRKNSKDGIPGYAFGMNDLISYAGPFFIGNLEWGDIQAARDRNMVKGSPVLAVLECKENNPIDWLFTGMSLSRLLLIAADEGISASYLNQPIEVPELNMQLRELLGLKGYPQLIIRMGYGKQVKPTPRRGVDEVILSLNDISDIEED